MKRLMLIGLMGTAVLTGCNSGKDMAPQSPALEPKIEKDPVVQSVLGGPVSLAGFVEANKIGNLSVERQIEAFKAFDERYQLAAYLLQHELAQDESTRISIAAEISKEVLDIYFDDFVQQSITDEFVKSYFEAHGEQFIERKLHVTMLSLENRESESKPEKHEFSNSELDTLASNEKNEAVKRVENETLEQRATHPVLWRELSTSQAGQWSKPAITPRLVTYYRVDNIDETPEEFENVKAELRYRLQQDAKNEEYRRLLQLAREPR